jgi:hypothetical protein
VYLSLLAPSVVMCGISPSPSPEATVNQCLKLRQERHLCSRRRRNSIQAPSERHLYRAFVGSGILSSNVRGPRIGAWNFSGGWSLGFGSFTLSKLRFSFLICPASAEVVVDLIDCG